MSTVPTCTLRPAALHSGWLGVLKTKTPGCTSSCLDHWGIFWPSYEELGIASLNDFWRFGVERYRVDMTRVKT